MVATGNDFIVIDNRLQVTPHFCSPHSVRDFAGSLGEGSRGGCRGTGCRLQELAKKVCSRKTGIGADGLLILEKSKCADFRMRIFNPDGSEPDMCGNGSRCIALYAKLHKIAKSPMTIETGAGILSAAVRNNKVKINMTNPKALKLSVIIKAKGKRYTIHHVNTGVPHAIYFTGNVDAIDMLSLGRKIRYHSSFKPQGTNFNVVEEVSGNTISIRTYERGVEAETLACGTGAVASAIISSIIKKISSPVNVHTKGGILKIYFKGNKKEGFAGVFLKGQAKEVFSGKIDL
jgi:diaminopimelate epimerase